MFIAGETFNVRVKAIPDELVWRTYDGPTPDGGGSERSPLKRRRGFPTFFSKCLRGHQYGGIAMRISVVTSAHGDE
jgi:hypothetical protein